jgi:hypothetical protein
MKNIFSILLNNSMVKIKIFSQLKIFLFSEKKNLFQKKKINLNNKLYKILN